MRRLKWLFSVGLLSLLGSCDQIPTATRTPITGAARTTAPAEAFHTGKEIRSVGLCCDVRLFVGQYTKPTVTVTYMDYSQEDVTGNPDGWVSSDPGIAGIASYGQIRGNAQGRALVTVWIGGVASNTIVVDVVPPPVVSSVQVTPSAVSLGTGSTQQLSVRVLDQYGQVMTGKSVAWSTDHTSVATVSSSGVIQGVAAGTTTVRATVDGVSGSAAVTVYPPSGPIVLTLSGPSYIWQEGWYTWSAAASGGTGSYTYQWEIEPLMGGAPRQLLGRGDTQSIYVDGTTGPFVVNVYVVSGGAQASGQQMVCNFIAGAHC